VNDQHRKRAFALAALAAVALLLLFLRARDDERTSSPSAAKSAGPRVVFGPAAPAPAPVPPAPPPVGEPPKPKPPGQPPVIDEIVVEKPEVCAGEENLITVRAHTTDGNDVFLHYMIGGSETTSTPLVTHSYEDRAQDTLYSQMLVTVEIVGAGGEKVVGRKSLQLRNPVFEDFYEKGIVSLMIALNPRFPEANADGVVVQGVRLFHARPTSVTIEKAVRIKQYPEQGGETAPESVDPKALLGTTEIPAGHGIDTKVAFDTAAEPDIFSVTYLLDGKTPEGWPVRGGFSVMRPPPKPTKSANNPVLDPVLRAKILAARKILGKEYVTDEDIFQLDREGKLAGLEIDPTPIPAPSGPPTNLPKPPHKVPANASGAPPPDMPPPGIGPTASPSKGTP
jgi:hypothetical protein